MNESVDNKNVAYSKLYSFASKTDKLMLYFGIISAIIAGMGLPSFIFLLGDVMDSYDPLANRSESLKTIRKITAYFVYIGIAIWITSYLFYGLLILFSESVSRKTRFNYLRKILE